MATWQIQQAKARFSDVVEQAQTQGPQFITRHGTERAVLISADEYARLSGHGGDLIDHLLGGPKVDGFIVTRDRAVDRSVQFDFDDDA